MPPPSQSGPGDLVPGEADYEAIESAVMETARGRWFLAEYARRGRQADTEQVLTAIARLESGLADERRERAAGAPSLTAVAQVVARGRAELAAVGEADGRVGDRLAATAERLQELAWELRETGSDEDACTVIEAGAAEIYAAAMQAVRLMRRAQLAGGVLDMLDERLAGQGGEEETAQAAPDPEPADERHDTLPANRVDSVLPSPRLMLLGPVETDADDLVFEADELTWSSAVDILELAAAPPQRPLRLPAVPVLAWRAAVEELEPPVFTAPDRPAVAPRRGPVTLAEIEALPFEDKVALFS